MPDRFAEVQKGLYRGGRPSPQELRMLKDLWGINKIVSLDDESGKAIKPICDDLGLNQIIWGLGDGSDPKVAALKKRIVPMLLHGGPTYVHCYHGKDRTGMTIAMFRVYSGWPLSKALAEAAKFGMGKGLSQDVRQSYYDAVKKYARELAEDSSNAMDAVTLTRQTNPFGPNGTGLDNYNLPRGAPIGPLPPHADPNFSYLSRTAQARLYCMCNSSNLLKPKTFWWSTAASAIANPTDSDGRLFSAGLASDTNIEYFGKPVDKNLIHHILTQDIDVAALRDGLYLVLYPNSLVNIQEEDDINDNMMPEVGTRDNSTDYTFVYPGSGGGVGGMPPSASGIVQLPYSGQGQV